MRGSVRGCHTKRVFHCELFSLSLAMYFTNMFPCTTLSICYLSYEGAKVLARIDMLYWQELIRYLPSVFNVSLRPGHD